MIPVPNHNEHSTPPYINKTWEENEWKLQKSQHEQRLQPLIQRFMKRKSQHQKDPILDFLFEYYAFRPAKLLQWNPGFGHLLKGSSANAFLKKAVYHANKSGVYLSPPSLSKKRIRSIRWIRNLLSESLDRPPVFNCFALHEWAMIYKETKIRHPYLTLRMAPEKLDQWLESQTIKCSHYDAFRFFTPPARPRNIHQPNIDTMEKFEQPGCLHTNMDLYKWAYKLSPWIGSDLIYETFMLAIQARTVDMRSSPYDLRPMGLEPICIETENGRKEFQRQQKNLQRNAIPIRTHLLKSYDSILQEITEKNK